jgi:dimeric dUTPase (all-alpha-NTP-PPase superfamily)
MLKVITALFNKRPLETWDIMKQNLEDVTIIGTQQEPRIAEQQFGLFQSVSLLASFYRILKQAHWTLYWHCIDIVETL